MAEPDKSATPPLQANKRTIVDALVLAFSHSDVREVVGTDALRMVLEARYTDMVPKAGALELDPLWKLLAGQPGFVPDAAIPPLCRFKSWEPQLGVTISLPATMRMLSKLDMSNRATKCRVPDAELAKVLNPVAPTPAAQPAAAPPPTGGAAEVIAQADKQVKRTRWAALAAGIAVVGVAVTVGLSIQSNVKTVEPKAFAGEIPVREALRNGDAVGAVLSEPSWLARPEDVRRKQLTEAVARLQPLGVSYLVILDPSGRVRAQASYGAAGTSIRFSP